MMDDYVWIVVNIILINQLMKKYAINYSRVFPDHRVAPDFKFNKQLMSGPSTYFRLLKDSYNAAGTKYFHVYLTLFSTAFIAGIALLKYYDADSKQTEIMKKNAPGYKYVVLTQRGGYGAYDNVLQKFEGEKGGLRDLPWDQ